MHWYFYINKGSSLSSRCRLRCGFGGPLHCCHVRLAQCHAQQTHLPPLHHSHRHLQHPGRVPGGYGHDNQRELGGCFAPVTRLRCAVGLILKTQIVKKGVEQKHEDHLLQTFCLFFSTVAFSSSAIFDFKNIEEDGSLG